MYHPLQVSGKPNAGSKGVDVGSTEETDNSSEEKRYEDLKSLAKQDVYQSLTAS